MALGLLQNQLAADGATTEASQAAILAANNDAMVVRASETLASSIFPMEVAIVVLGCFVVTGFILLMRESRIEKDGSL